MPKMTLLEIVQSVLSTMDSDNVNSITETVESEQVAQEAKRVFYDFCDRINLESQENLIKLAALGDTNHPNYLKLPDNVEQISGVQYDSRQDATDTRINYVDIQYLDPKSFLNRVNKQIEADNYTTITDFSGMKMNIRTDTNPSVYTSFDDKYLVFDSYNNLVDSSLQNSKSICFGRQTPSFIMQDSFVIPLDERVTMAYLSEVTSSCFVNIKQQGNSKEEQRARRGFLRLQSKHSRISNPWNLDPDAFDFGMPSKKGNSRLCPGPNNVNLSS